MAGSAGEFSKAGKNYIPVFTGFIKVGVGAAYAARLYPDEHFIALNLRHRDVFDFKTGIPPCTASAQRPFIQPFIFSE